MCRERRVSKVYSEIIKARARSDIVRSAMIWSHLSTHVTFHVHMSEVRVLVVATAYLLQVHAVRYRLLRSMNLSA